jgi:hypothetical protein
MYRLFLSFAKIILMCCLRIDQIVEIAPRWQPTSERTNDEDWNDEQDENNEIEVLEGAMRTYDVPKTVRSATGEPLHSASPTTITVQLGRMNTGDLHRSGIGYLGSLSRFLCLGLQELDRKQQVHQTETGAYIMKRELRQRKTNKISRIRKVSINPSSIYYEGPQSEEYCAVTRHFIAVEDRFLRISFRDEGKPWMSHYLSLMKLMLTVLHVRLWQIQECVWFDECIISVHPFYVGSRGEHLWKAL